MPLRKLLQTSFPCQKSFAAALRGAAAAELVLGWSDLGGAAVTYLEALATVQLIVEKAFSAASHMNSSRSLGCSSAGFGSCLDVAVDGQDDSADGEAEEGALSKSDNDSHDGTHHDWDVHLSHTVAAVLIDGSEDVAFASCHGLLHLKMAFLLSACAGAAKQAILHGLAEHAAEMAAVVIVYSSSNACKWWHY